MKRKLTPAKITAIRERKGAGSTIEELAAAFKCSVGTISNALHAPGPSAPKVTGRKATVSKSAGPPDGTEAAPPTPDDLRRSLAAQVRELQADAKNAPTPALRAATNRLLVATQQLLSKLTPPDPTVAPTGMMLVPADEMRELGEKSAVAFEKLVRGAFAEQSTWPKCPTCKRSIPPEAPHHDF